MTAPGFPGAVTLARKPCVQPPTPAARPEACPSAAVAPRGFADAPGPRASASVRAARAGRRRIRSAAPRSASLVTSARRTAAISLSPLRMIRARTASRSATSPGTGAGSGARCDHHGRVRNGDGNEPIGARVAPSAHDTARQATTTRMTNAISAGREAVHGVRWPARARRRKPSRVGDSLSAGCRRGVAGSPCSTGCSISVPPALVHDRSRLPSTSVHAR